MKRIQLFVLALLAVATPADAGVTKNALTSTRAAVDVFSPEGRRTLPAVRSWLDIRFANGKTQRGDLVVLYDPETKHYLWLFAPENPGKLGFLPDLQLGAMGVYSSPAGMVMFCMPTDLSVREFTKSASSLDEAEQLSIAEIESRLPTFEGNGFATDGTDLSVIQQIGREFACPPFGDADFRPVCGFHAERFASIQREEGLWRLVVETRLRQEIVLDSKFQFVSTRRLPGLPQPAQ